MMKLVLALILVGSAAWSRDQASSRSKSAPRPFCPVGKDYLQSTLSALTYPDLTNQNDPNHRSNAIGAKLLQIGPLPKPLINPDCVDAALSKVSAGARKSPNEQFRSNRFIKCNSANQPIDNQDEPCDSAEYKLLMHSSFELTTKCLKGFVTRSKDVQVQNTWVEGYFKMLSTESGLHVNVASRIGAIGVGQLRAEYIADFRNRTLHRLRDYLLNEQSSPGCKILAEKLLKTERITKLYKATQFTDPKTNKTSTRYTINVCANIDINDDQPLLNLIISFANLKLYKESTVDAILSNPKYAAAFKNLSQSELLDLEIKLVSWAYNLGATRLKQHIEKILDTKYADKAISSVRDFIVDADIEGKRNYVFGLEDRYKKVLSGRRSCRTDLSN
jgi:hypothetical protein